MWILILIYSYLAFRHEQLIYKSQKRRNRSFMSIFFCQLATNHVCGRRFAEHTLFLLVSETTDNCGDKVQLISLVDGKIY